MRLRRRGDAGADTLKLFRHEFEAHIKEGRCTPVPAPWRRAPDGGSALMDLRLAVQLGIIGFTFFMLINVGGLGAGRAEDHGLPAAALRPHYSSARTYFSRWPTS